jgi:hypothetical protein
LVWPNPLAVSKKLKAKIEKYFFIVALKKLHQLGCQATKTSIFFSFCLNQLSVK